MKQVPDTQKVRIDPARNTLIRKGVPSITNPLDESALDYSLSEALRGLGKAEVRAIREMIDELGGEVSPEEGREIRERAKARPEVRRAQARVEAAQKAEEAFRKALARGRLRDTEFIIGPERLAAMKAQTAGARAELGEA
ncbi:hypothetical protein LCGC14_1823770, partial [marine sediment metagenome]